MFHRFIHHACMYHTMTGLKFYSDLIGTKVCCGAVVAAVVVVVVVVCAVMCVVLHVHVHVCMFYVHFI